MVAFFHFLEFKFSDEIIVFEIIDNMIRIWVTLYFFKVVCDHRSLDSFAPSDINKHSPSKKWKI